jgi:mannose-6-phosphate isomerase-like protein (cupin superfamily)
MEYVKREKDLPWTAHPFLPIQVKYLVTQKFDRADVTCFLAQTPKGTEIPEHIHETQEDILFLLAGKGKMWMEGIGDFDLEKGTCIRVPRNTKHKIYDVTEEILVYDIFIPPLV